MTYSIVARDAETGQMGVAVQSHYFSVGSVVPWAEAGVGAIATQAQAEVDYGPVGLGLLRAGKPAERVLAALTASDPGYEHRQAAVLDANGGVSAHTGARCIAEAGHHLADGASAQGNMLERATAWGAMVEAFTSTGGPLVDRLLAALDAAEAEGGDARGRQSAAVVVVSGTRTGRLAIDRPIELRVEDHPDPLTELRRLVGLHRLYERISAALGRLTAGEVQDGYAELEQLHRDTPDQHELAFWFGTVTGLRGDIEGARRVLDPLYAANPRWRLTMRNAVAAGVLPMSESVLDQLTA